MREASIPALEELALNAWPALQTQLFDGWALRLAEGCTKRANSVHPLYRSTLPPAAKIAYCEDFYGRAGLPAIFKLTPAARPAGLDRELAGRGYERLDETSLQTLALAGEFRPPRGPVSFTTYTLSRWLEVLDTIAPLSAGNRSTLARMLGSLHEKGAFGVVLDGDSPVACGLCVAARGYAGLFDLVVAKERRGQGLGEFLTASLLSWAATAGARTAYLQVVAGNTVAENLYRKLGFRERYRYWYRRQRLRL